MTLPEIKGALWRAYTDISRNHSLQMAAALSYYFVLSLFPALIFLSAFVTGSLLLTALSVMVVGPRFGEWLAARVHLSALFVFLWPYLHWAIAIGFAVLAVEALYFLAPNVKQRFLATLPGAILAVGCWIGLSYLLGVYFRHFANFNKTYGTLGAAVALMVWLYWTGFAMLVGAELNSELAKITKKGKLQEKQQA